MALEAVVTPGIVLATGEKITRAKLNQLGNPTVEVEGTVAGMEPDSLTAAMTNLGGSYIPEAMAKYLRGQGKLPVAELCEVGSHIINVKAFGALGDNESHPVSEWITAGVYDNLSEIQADYPWVLHLTDEIDYAAIQKAMDVAWQYIRASTGTTYPSPSHAPVVVIPAGLYWVNRTIIVPPKVNVRGDGTGTNDTFIWYTAVNDSVWNYIFITTSTIDALFSEAAHAMFYIRARLSASTAHITEGVSHTANNYDGAGYEGPVGGSFSNMVLCNNTAGGICILANGLDYYTFSDMQLTGYGNSTGFEKYGIAVTAQGGGGNAEDLTVRNVFFHGLKDGVLVDGCNQLQIINCRTSNVRHPIYLSQVQWAVIQGNVFGSSQFPMTGKTSGIEFTGNGVAVVGNTFQGFDTCLFFAGANVTVTGNTFECAGNMSNPYHGYAVKVVRVTDKFDGTLRYPVTYQNTGINIFGNALNYTGNTTALDAYKPFYFKSDVATESSLVINAGGNGMHAAGGTTPTQYRLVGGVKATIIDENTHHDTIDPNVPPKYQGQIWVNTTTGVVYTATRLAQKITNGNIEAGKNYYVHLVPNGDEETPEVTSGYVTYNGSNTNNGYNFLGVSSQTTFGVSSDNIEVLESLKNVWQPVAYDRLAQIFTHATVTTATFTISLDDALSMMEGVQEIPFDSSEAIPYVELPKPDGCKGKQFRLLITKPATAGNYPIYLKSTWTDETPDPDVVHNYLMDRSGNGVSTGTLALTAGVATAKAVHVAVFCDGNFWHVMR